MYGVRVCARVGGCGIWSWLHVVRLSVPQHVLGSGVCVAGSVGLCVWYRHSVEWCACVYWYFVCSVVFMLARG